MWKTLSKLIGASVLIAVLAATELSAAPPPANIIGMAGRVEILKAGAADWTDAKAAQEIFSGDKVRTSEPGSAGLLFDDGSHVKLNSGTQIELKQEGDISYVIIIRHGEIWAKVNPKTPRISRFETTAANAMVKGTEIDLMVMENGQTVLAVVEGQMLFANAWGSVVVGDSQQSTAEEGSAPTPPTLIDTKNKVRWTLLEKSIGSFIFMPHFSQNPKDLARLQDKYLFEYLGSPSDTSAALNLARVRQDMKMFEKAREDYEYLLRVTPDSPELYNNIGEILFYEGDTAGAKPEFEKALKIDNGYARADINMAMLYLWDEAPETALDYADRAVRSGKDNTETALARVALASVLWRLGKEDESVVELYKALRDDPGCYQAAVRLSVANLVRNRLPEAEQNAKEAVALAPFSSSAHATLASAYFYMRRFKESRREIDAAISLDPFNASAYYTLASLDDVEEKPGKALGHILKSVALDSKDPYSRDTAAIIYERNLKYTAAIGEYTRAIELQPDPSFHTNLGGLYEHLNKPSQAFEEADKALSLNPKYAGAYDLRGLLYLQQLGQPEKAIDEYKKAIALEPDSASYRSHLSDSYIAINRLDDALNETLQAVTIVPDSAEYHYDLGNVYYHMGIYDAAISELRQALALDPNNADAHWRLAYIFKLQGRDTESINEEFLGTLSNPAVITNPIKANLKNEFSASYGNDDAFIGNMYIARRSDNGKQNYALFAEDSKNGGFRANSDYDHKRAMLYFTHQPDVKRAVYLKAFFIKQNTGMPGPSSGWGGDDPNNRNLYQSTTQYLSYRFRPGPRSDFMLRIYHSDRIPEYLTPDAFPPQAQELLLGYLNKALGTVYHERNRGFEFRQDFAYSTTHSLTFGGAISANSMNGVESGRTIDLSGNVPTWIARTWYVHQPFKMHSYYLLDKITATKRLHLNLGVKTDFHSYSGKFTSPRVTADYRLSGKDTLQFIHRGYFDNVVDIFLKPSDSGYFFHEDEGELGDIHRNKYYELSHLHRFSHGLFSRVTFFRKDAKIYDAYAPLSLTSLAQQTGVQADIELQMSRRLSGSLLYTASSYKNKTPGASFNFTVPYKPKEEIKAALNYFHAGININLSTNFKSGQYTNTSNTIAIPHYTTFDAIFSYEPSIRRRIFVECLNIFNKYFEDPQYYPGDPRRWRVGIDFLF